MKKYGNMWSIKYKMLTKKLKTLRPRSWKDIQIWPLKLNQSYILIQRLQGNTVRPAIHIGNRTNYFPSGSFSCKNRKTLISSMAASRYFSMFLIIFTATLSCFLAILWRCYIGGLIIYVKEETWYIKTVKDNHEGLVPIRNVPFQICTLDDLTKRSFAQCRVYFVWNNVWSWKFGIMQSRIYYICYGACPRLYTTDDRSRRPWPGYSSNDENTQIIYIYGILWIQDWVISFGTE